MNPISGRREENEWFGVLRLREMDPDTRAQFKLRLCKGTLNDIEGKHVRSAPRSFTTIKRNLCWCYVTFGCKRFAATHQKWNNGDESAPTFGCAPSLDIVHGGLMCHLGPFTGPCLACRILNHFLLAARMSTNGVPALVLCPSSVFVWRPIVQSRHSIRGSSPRRPKAAHHSGSFQCTLAKSRS